MIEDAHRELGKFVCSRYSCSRVSEVMTEMGGMCKEHSAVLEFPLQHARSEATVEHARLPRYVPWEFVRSHDSQARRNHGQTLARLAERGGLDVTEALAVVKDRPWEKLEWRAAIDEFMAIFASWKSLARASEPKVPPVVEGSRSAELAAYFARLSENELEAARRFADDDHDNHYAEAAVFKARAEAFAQASLKCASAKAEQAPCAKTFRVHDELLARCSLGAGHNGDHHDSGLGTWWTDSDFETTLAHAGVQSPESRAREQAPMQPSNAELLAVIRKSARGERSLSLDSAQLDWALSEIEKRIGGEHD